MYHSRCQTYRPRRCINPSFPKSPQMHMIRKGQLGYIKDEASSAANQFYSLAF